MMQVLLGLVAYAGAGSVPVRGFVVWRASLHPLLSLASAGCDDYCLLIETRCT